MSNKLDYFRPTRETLAGVRRQLVEAGIPSESINDDWVEAAAAAMAKWINCDPNGQAYAIKLLNFEVAHGDPSKEYVLLPVMAGAPEKKLKPGDVCFFRGIQVCGEPFPITQLRITDKEKECCDSCGISSHCCKTLLDIGRDRLTTLCQNCILAHENLRIRDQGNYGACQDCTNGRCPNHPKRGLEAAIA
jgi:hypothetical protein